MRKNAENHPKSSHPAAIFSALPEKMLTNSGRIYYRKVLKRKVTPRVKPYVGLPRLVLEITLLSKN